MDIWFNRKSLSDIYMIKMMIFKATFQKLHLRLEIIDTMKVLKIKDLDRSLIRSSRPEVFCKKVVLRNFAKCTGKHLCQSLFFNKVAGLRLATLLKKRVWHRCYPVNFMKFLRTTFIIKHLRWLLLFASK